MSDDALDKIGEIVYGRHIRGFVLWPLTGDEKERISEVLEDLIDAAVDRYRENEDRRW